MEGLKVITDCFTDFYYFLKAVSLVTFAITVVVFSYICFVEKGN